ncbi:GNAT family N-acetyltransferase [Kitasatospora sp. NPDC018619]|uniref:GNAT family N-acetyltransferase n=1 Tax=unclassified Kitasatospora TaxID=2633591 RepID=UPI0037ADA8FA
MTNTAPRRSGPWTVAPADVTAPEALELLRAYYYDVANRYYRLHLGREGTPEELESGLAGSPSDHLAAPDGAFLIGRHDGAAHSCAGLRRLDAGTAELTRVFVRPGLRGTGGGTVLLAAVEDAARSLGARRIVLDTRLDLVEARALYTRHGYREIPAYSHGPYAQVWYGKELGPAASPVPSAASSPVGR